MWKTALGLLEEMRRAGPRTRPNVRSYTAAIAACGRAGEWRQALELHHKISEEGLAPDGASFNAVISAARFVTACPTRWFCTSLMSVPYASKSKVVKGWVGRPLPGGGGKKKALWFLFSFLTWKIKRCIFFFFLTTVLRSNRFIFAVFYLLYLRFALSTSPRLFFVLWFLFGGKGEEGVRGDFRSNIDRTPARINPDENISTQSRCNNTCLWPHILLFQTKARRSA